MTKIGGNRWNDYVREFAKKHNTTYGCAISMPECKEGYKALKAKEAKPKGKKGRPKKSAKANDDDFGVSPEEVSKEPIKLHVQELEEAKPSTEPTKKNVTIKKKEKALPNIVVSGEVKPSEESFNKKIEEANKAIDDNIGDYSALKKKARPLVKHLIELYNSNKLTKSQDKLVLALSKRWNLISDEAKMSGKGRLNRMRLKRGRGEKGGSAIPPQPSQEVKVSTASIPPPPPPEPLPPPPPPNAPRQQIRRRFDANGNVVIGRGRGRPRKTADPCWDGYKQLGMKTKNGKEVPNCIPVEEGGNIIKDLVKEGKVVINAIGNKYFGNSLPPNFKKILNKYGNQEITSLTLGRTPVPSYLNTALNIVSLGEWKKRFASQPYDKLYHLFMVIQTTGGKFLIEKNERLNATTKIYNNAEMLPISGSLSGLTPNILLEKTEKLMGASFYSYSAFNNNCQHFISSVMKANHLGSPKDFEFVKQDTEQLFEGQERLKKVADTVTGIGAVANRIYQGGKEKKPRGRPRGGVKSLKKISYQATQEAGMPQSGEARRLLREGLLLDKGILQLPISEAQYLRNRTQYNRDKHPELYAGVPRLEGTGYSSSDSSSDSDSDSDMEYGAGSGIAGRSILSLLTELIQELDGSATEASAKSRAGIFHKRHPEVTKAEVREWLENHDTIPDEYYNSLTFFGSVVVAEPVLGRGKGSKKPDLPTIEEHSTRLRRPIDLRALRVTDPQREAEGIIRILQEKENEYKSNMLRNVLPLRKALKERPDDRQIKLRLNEAEDHQHQLNDKIYQIKLYMKEIGIRNPNAEVVEGMGRSPELKHQLRNYNDILGHLSSHLLSKEKQDPKDARDALRYAKELVRVLKQF